MTKRTVKRTEEELMSEYIASDPTLWKEYMAIIQSGLDAYEEWKENRTPENEQLLHATDVALDNFEKEHADFIAHDPRRTSAPLGYYSKREEERTADYGSTRGTRKQ